MKATCNNDTCFLCRNCLPEWREAVAVHKTNLKLKKGETLFNEGDAVTGIYFVYSGVVKVHKKWGEGKELIIRFAADGTTLGYRGLASDKIYTVTATAIEPSVICYLDLDFFRASLKVNHDLAYQLMVFFAEELGEAEQNMRDLAHSPVKERLKKALDRLQRQFGKDKDGYINIILPRQDIAQYVGTTYETVFRTLAEMEHEGSVITEGKRIGLKE